MNTYIVYKSINLVNNKYYIGKHRITREEFDFYFGSGSAIQNAIKKYGIEQFIRITLFETIDEQECYLKEEEILGELWITDTNCYNKQPGGKGFSSGLNHYTQGNGFTDEHRTNLKKARKQRLPATAETRQKMSDSRKGTTRNSITKQKMSIAQTGKNNPMYGKKHTAEKKKEISVKLRGKYVAEKNSRFTGYYVTPCGKFASVAQIGKIITNISKGTVATWCKNSDRVITANMAGISKFLTNDMIGKTFKEIGFYKE